MYMYISCFGHIWNQQLKITFLFQRDTLKVTRRRFIYDELLNQVKIVQTKDRGAKEEKRSLIWIIRTFIK